MIIEPILDGIDTILAWLSTSLKQTVESYCDLQTADDAHTLVAHDGSLVSVIQVEGVGMLVGQPEFEQLHQSVTLSLQNALSRPGHSVQVYFSHDKDTVICQIEEIYRSARNTASDLQFDFDDLFAERLKYISSYCATEKIYWVLWTRPLEISSDQYKKALRDKAEKMQAKAVPPFKYSQDVLAAIPDLRNVHDSFVRSFLHDFEHNHIYAKLLEVHDALHQMRMIVDPDFTDESWQPILPGDKIPFRAAKRAESQDVSHLLWPPLARQLLPRDARNLDLKTVLIGDKLYAPITIELFPKQVHPFVNLLRRTLPTHVPWRICFLIDGDGIRSLRFKKMLAGILSFSAQENRLINEAEALLSDINVRTDDAVVKLRVALATWAPEGNMRLLRTRASQLAKAVQGWGNCEVSEISGDAFAGAVSSMMGVSSESVATASVAPLPDVTYMLPLVRPASPWTNGALLFRSPDGKLWPYQPGSGQQTTWIDLIYARPGSGKSVLSNTLNLALCLLGGLKRLPRIAIVDIGPSSSGLISLLESALPREQRHYVAYHRIRMTKEYCINPFDTQLGCRYPTHQERAFLVNFITLLATPIGSPKPYDAMSDMVGMIVDEMYATTSDQSKPYSYTSGIEPLVDAILDEIGFVGDTHTTWWEVTDTLFLAGFTHEATIAQRYAVPLISDAASVCRNQAVSDLYGKISVPTGENIIDSFARMISSVIREYPVLSGVTQFDLGEARIVSLDLDEVAKTGGDSADRQTAVMYMLARYVLARDFYLTEESLNRVPEQYIAYHKQRVKDIAEDPKRIVYDEFHRTSKAPAVRDQVIVDMREGRKWKVQVGLLSQSIDDFDSVMIEFATSVYIMDAGPTQAVKKTAETFGLSETAQLALKTRVHGPREGGATFLAQFATKSGINTQLLTLTLGPVELWAFSTTADDANVRNQLYAALGPKIARSLLARLFPSGSAVKLIEARLERIQEEHGHALDVSELGVVDELVEQIISEYKINPDFRVLPN